MKRKTSRSTQGSSGKTGGARRGPKARVAEERGVEETSGRREGSEESDRAARSGAHDARPDDRTSSSWQDDEGRLGRGRISYDDPRTFEEHRRGSSSGYAERDPRATRSPRDGSYEGRYDPRHEERPSQRYEERSEDRRSRGGTERGDDLESFDDRRPSGRYDGGRHDGGRHDDGRYEGERDDRGAYGRRPDRDDDETRPMGRGDRAGGRDRDDDVRRAAWSEADPADYEGGGRRTPRGRELSEEEGERWGSAPRDGGGRERYASGPSDRSRSAYDDRGGRDRHDERSTYGSRGRDAQGGGRGTGRDLGPVRSSDHDERFDVRGDDGSAPRRDGGDRTGLGSPRTSSTRGRHDANDREADGRATRAADADRGEPSEPRSTGVGRGRTPRGQGAPETGTRATRGRGSDTPDRAGSPSTTSARKGRSTGRSTGRSDGAAQGRATQGRGRKA